MVVNLILLFSGIIENLQKVNYVTVAAFKMQQKATSIAKFRQDTDRKMHEEETFANNVWG